MKNDWFFSGLACGFMAGLAFCLVVGKSQPPDPQWEPPTGVSYRVYYVPDSLGFQYVVSYGDAWDENRSRGQGETIRAAIEDAVAAYGAKR